jgi:hypothetical protein
MTILVHERLVKDRGVYLPDIENTRNSGVGSEADQVDSDTEED